MSFVENRESKVSMLRKSSTSRSMMNQDQEESDSMKPVLLFTNFAYFNNFIGSILEPVNQQERCSQVQKDRSA